MSNFSFLSCLEVAEKFVLAGVVGWVPSEYCVIGAFNQVVLS